MMSAEDGDGLGMECGCGSIHCMRGRGILLDDKESVVFEQRVNATMCSKRVKTEFSSGLQ